MTLRFRRNQAAPPPAPPRIVRLHTVGPGGKADLTFEGVLTGIEEGHYVLARPRVLESAESAAPEPPRGTVYEIPVDRVWFREILAEDADL